MMVNYVDEKTNKVLMGTDLSSSDKASMYLEEVSAWANVGTLEIVRIDEDDDYCEVIVREVENRIKKTRKESGITQAEAAECLGVPKRTLQDWEDGKRNTKGSIDEIIKKLRILGTFTEEGRSAIASGEMSWKVAEGQARIQTAKKMSRWGRFPDTFSACLNQIPDGVIGSLSGENLADLVDTIKSVYDDGVRKGKGSLSDID